MKVSASKNRLHWSLKVLLWINILTSLLLIGAYLNTHISPNSVSYLSFLGLAYPILLLISILFILVWLIFKRKLIFISAITILLGASHLKHFYAVNFSQAELSNPVKVLSYNVRIFDFWNTDTRIQNRNDIFSFLKDENADILCFQEFYYQAGATNFVTKDSMIDLLETPYYHERYTHELSRKRYFGVATFSKYPIIKKGEISFENDANNFCIYSDIVVRTDTVRVFNAHLGSIRFQSDDYDFFGDQNNPDPKQTDAGQRILGRLKSAFEKRAVQAEKVSKEIESSPYPAILCGDFNDTPVSYCYRLFYSLLDDAFVESGNGIGQTYIGNLPSNRIDYIFHDVGLKSANFQTHQVNLSDHKPISCEIEL